MPAPAHSAVALSADECRQLRDLLGSHDVGLAIVFGSTARSHDDPADLDIAVEFATKRPTDDGYAAAYIDLYTALEDEFARPVDLVDVHSMSPGFARVVIDDGVLIRGSSDRLATLERRLAGDSPSVADAQERVSAAASRLEEGSP